MYSNVSNVGLLPLSKPMNPYVMWNYHSDYYPGDVASHHYHPYFLQKPNIDELALDKFHHDTLVKLETGEKKNIQQLTTYDLIASAKQNQQYSSLLARVDYIGCVDKLTGKVELRFHINGLQKPISHYVSHHMPFFVHQYSCWSSISPKYTFHLTGLNCRQLECGDIIIAVIERQNIPSKVNVKPNYSQQSPTKCLVERYMNEKISSSTSSKEYTVSKHKRFKVYNE